MGRAAYRVEVDYPSVGRPRYFLVKDVRVGEKRTKVKKYLGINPPDTREKARLSSKHATEMELRAAAQKGDLSVEAYQAEFLSREHLLEVERVRSIYDSVLGFLTTNEVEAYESQFEVSYIQGTTSIEGNTLTRSEAESLLLHGLTPEGKALREINEVQNFKKVVAYRNSFKRKVTAGFIQNLHALVMDNIDRETPGAFRRRDDLGIAGCDLQVTPSSLIEEELDKIISEYYYALDREKHPFEQAVAFHYKFEMIHPFTDGNGRVGREILNYMLTRSHYPRLLFLGKDRTRYIGALLRGNVDNYSAMVSTFAELIIEQRLRILEERLRQIAPGVKRIGQTRLEEFVTE
jgi:Fic family protein